MSIDKAVSLINHSRPRILNYCIQPRSVEPIKQILAELIVADHQRQISLRRRDQANIEANGLVAA